MTSLINNQGEFHQNKVKFHPPQVNKIYNFDNTVH